MSIRKFHIVIDGILHEVEVEEVRSNTAAGRSTSSVAAVSQAAPAQVISSTHSPASTPACSGNTAVTAPLQGTIASVAVTEGQRVKSGDILVVIEAMKMENEILAPTDGTVASVSVKKGDSVAAGDLLVTLR